MMKPRMKKNVKIQREGLHDLPDILKQDGTHEKNKRTLKEEKLEEMLRELEAGIIIDPANETETSSAALNLSKSDNEYLDGEDETEF